MQSICWTTRLFSRALRNGFSTLVEPNIRVKPHFVSVACGFPKDILRSKYKLGKFGEDAWFIASTQNADVIGTYTHVSSLTHILLRIAFVFFSSSNLGVNEM